MKIFGINITFGDPVKRATRQAEIQANEMLQMLVRFKKIRFNRIKDGRYYPWWKSHIDEYADYIIENTDEGELRQILTSKLCAYLVQREMDIELKNDELQQVADEIRCQTK